MFLDLAQVFCFTNSLGIGNFGGGSVVVLFAGGADRLFSPHNWTQLSMAKLGDKVPIEWRRL